ncbi:MAG TPA: ATP synthase F1 subunit gamma [Chloroflexota bacterium]|nr:ATP synthase F1 subunit gamma [Chloroflexota bacterium]
MASRREIRRRIRSIKNTAQITKAMQMVAASRMRRAQSRVASARPYAEHIAAIVADIGARPGAGEHPLLARREIRAVDIVTITPDRGLAGALVTNINRETSRLLQSVGAPASIVAVGRKGRDFALRTRTKLTGEFIGMGDHPTITQVGPIAREILDDFESGRADAVYLVYTEFISTLRQRPRTVQLLPVTPPEAEEQPAGTAPWNYEPDNPGLVLSQLLPRFIEFTIYHALLESIASEHSARMIAMSNATDNANELIKDLTLLANKARQAEITKEIAEISGAAEAIRTG